MAIGRAGMSRSGLLRWLKQENGTGLLHGERSRHAWIGSTPAGRSSENKIGLSYSSCGMSSGKMRKYPKLDDFEV